MPDLKTIAPHIKRAAVVNGVLFLYFLMPNLIPFLAVFIAFISLVPNSKDTLSSIFNWKEGTTLNYFLKTYQTYMNLGLIEQILIFVYLKLAFDLVWLLPSWFTIFLVAEYFAVLGFLEDVGVHGLIKKYIKFTKESVEKGIALIPRYEPSS